MAGLDGQAVVIPNDRPTEWLMFSDIADETKVKLQTLYRLRHEGRGPKAYKIGGCLRVRREDLTVWIESQNAA